LNIVFHKLIMKYLPHTFFATFLFRTTVSLDNPRDFPPKPLFLKDTAQTSKDASKLIVGGEPADPGRYPYQVGLWDDTDSFTFCGGSLISPEWVLSAAHCGGFATHVHIGRYDLSDPNENYELIPVVLEFKHPDFNPWTAENDLMLIKLEYASDYTPVTLTDGSLSLTAGTNVTVMGWGATFEGDYYGSEILLEVEVDVVGHAECNDAYNDTINEENMICASREGKDSCQGDSGGPLIIKGTNEFSDIQVGVVSWGIGCADPDFPGVYASVASGLDFFESITTCSYADGEDETSFEDCCAVSCEDGVFTCGLDGCGDSSCVDYWDYVDYYYDDDYIEYYDDEYLDSLFCTDDATYYFDDDYYDIIFCPIECAPTSQPSITPSSIPTYAPSSTPSIMPSSIPSSMPSIMPTSVPTPLPSSDESSNLVSLIIDLLQSFIDILLFLFGV